MLKSKFPIKSQIQISKTIILDLGFYLTLDIGILDLRKTKNLYQKIGSQLIRYWKFRLSHFIVIFIAQGQCHWVLQDVYICSLTQIAQKENIQDVHKFENALYLSHANSQFHFRKRFCLSRF